MQKKPTILNCLRVYAGDHGNDQEGWPHVADCCSPHLPPYCNNHQDADTSYLYQGFVIIYDRDSKAHRLKGNHMTLLWVYSPVSQMTILKWTTLFY